MTERQKQHQGRSAGDDAETNGGDASGIGGRADNPKADVERGTDELPAPNEERASPQGDGAPNGG